MPRPSRKAVLPTTPALPQCALLWIYRILVPLGGAREVMPQSGCRDDQIVRAVGLGAFVDDPEVEWDARAIRIELRRLYARAERELAKASVPRQLERNVARLASTIGLNATDCRILEFAVLLHTERMLDDAADALGSLSSAKVCTALAGILSIPESEIRAALAPNALLARSGIVCIDRSSATMLRSKLDLLSSDFADILVSADAEPIELLRKVIATTAAPTLRLTDFSHVDRWLEVLLPYLRGALESQRVGCNVFIYGAPGTGKSELSRVLAGEVGAELLEVASCDADGDPVTGERRLRNVQAAQSIFSKRRALLVFDEAEDVFGDGDVHFGRRSTAQLRKAWMNRTLEANPLPTLWLSNRADCLDPAFVRRFDIVMELPIPPREQRARILSNVCGALIAPSALVRIAESDHVPPAIVTRAAAVLSAIQQHVSRPAEEVLETLIASTLQAQGQPRLKTAEAATGPYDPTFLNVSSDVIALAAGLARRRAGRLCLYGPPGTGKTACARWLAERIGVPIVTVCASDLLGMYVGETERRIADSFERAQREAAMLLIDECDSFLRQRTKALRSWEVTSVNEMLTRMESFPGIFVASTNLVDELDPAALRRFDCKIEFGYLTPEQAARAFGSYCASMGLDDVPDAVLKTVRTLEALTPGDLAAMARRHEFAPFCDADALLDALRHECTLKGVGRAIGFTP